MADEELRDWLALTLVPGLGPRLTDMLMQHFRTPAAIRRADEHALRAVPHVGDKLSSQFAAALRTVDVDAELELMRQFGVTALVKGTPEYPRHLTTIDDAPPVLYVRGAFSPADVNAVAVIGSRACTSYGLRITKRLCVELAKNGYTVVSGLARGIDGEAHKGALEGGGRTVAVLAGGLSKIYPPEHKELAERVAASGALISETPMAMAPQPGMFHARNRLISGLALGVVVVEANERSGTLITAGHAAEQNRELFAFPGNVDSAASGGTLALIRNHGAKLIRNIDDLLEDLQRFPTTPPPPEPSAEQPAEAGPPPGMDEAQGRAWAFLTEVRHFDVLMREMAMTVPELTRVLMGMEMKKWVRRLPGNQYERR